MIEYKFIINNNEMREMGSNHLLSTTYQNFIRKGELPTVDSLLERLHKLLNYQDNNLDDEDKSAFAKIEIEGCKVLLDIHNKRGLYEEY